LSGLLLTCLHDQNKVAFLEGWLSSQLEVFEYFFIALIDWIKAGPPKKPLLF